MPARGTDAAARPRPTCNQNRMIITLSACRRAAALRSGGRHRRRYRLGPSPISRSGRNVGLGLFVPAPRCDNRRVQVISPLRSSAHCFALQSPLFAVPATLGWDTHSESVRETAKEKVSHSISNALIFRGSDRLVVRSPGNCAPPRASHGSGTTRAEGRRPIGSSRRSMIGSPRVLQRPISERRRR
jgi:hypothetical protein